MRSVFDGGVGCISPGMSDRSSRSGEVWPGEKRPTGAGDTAAVMPSVADEVVSIERGVVGISAAECSEQLLGEDRTDCEESIVTVKAVVFVRSRHYSSMFDIRSQVLREWLWGRLGMLLRRRTRPFDSKSPL